MKNKLLYILLMIRGLCHGDGNGDGICQSGETCKTFVLTDKIEFDKVENGDLLITSKYLTDDAVALTK